MIPGTIPIPASVMPIVTYLGSNVAGVSSSFTFNGCNFGDAAADRQIIVAYTVVDIGTFSVDSVSIGGVSATLVVGVNSADGNRIRAAISRSLVPTGTSGTIIVNTNTTCNYCAIAWYSVTGLNSSSANSVGSDDSGQTLTTSLNILPGGFGIAVAGSNNSGDASWSGLTETTDFDILGDRFTSAMEQYSGGSTGQTVSVTFTSNAVEAMAAAAWR